MGEKWGVPQYPKCFDFSGGQKWGGVRRNVTNVTFFFEGFPKTAEKSQWSNLIADFLGDSDLLKKTKLFLFVN